MTYANALSALADGTRRDLFERIAREPASVGVLAGEFPISQPAVSQHLKILKAAELVTVTRDGTRRVYAVHPEGVKALRDYVDRFWSDVLDSFARDTPPKKKGRQTVNADALKPLVKTVHVNLDLESAFRRFTEGIAEWWPSATHSVSQDGSATVRMPGAVGGQIVETGPDGASHHWGTVLEWSPPNGIRFTWHPGREASKEQTVDVRFERSPEGTKVTLTHDGWDTYGEKAREMRSNYDAGWDIVLAPFFNI